MTPVYIVLADIHSNLDALDAVLEQIDYEQKTHMIVLGDVVGYGPNPNECIERLKTHDANVIAGNHDAAVTGKMSTSLFNRLASEAVKWTRDEITDKNLEFLRSRPETQKIDDFHAVHGSPDDPLLEYIMSPNQAQTAMRQSNCKFLGAGHTHKPMCVIEEKSGSIEPANIHGSDEIYLKKDIQQIFINPGSVGQPRDGDPRASYAILNPTENVISWRRVEYPIEAVQKKIRNAGLPPALAERLQFGQ